MTKFRCQDNFKYQITKPKVLSFLLCALVFFSALCFGICNLSHAQQTEDIEVTLDLSLATTPLPKIFKPNIDLGGRGLYQDKSWPQSLAAREVLDIWQKDIGFNGLYRMQYSLWDIHELLRDKDTQDKLLENYSEVIKRITDSGGTVILSIFGTPAGLGRVLDKKSPPVDLRAFKEFAKGIVRDLSCKKKYNIWYEIWNAPDLDDFFLGRKQDYLNLYRAFAESINELRAEEKIYIPVGGPSTSAWFQDLEGNTIITPEKSLIYELIKFCYRYHLPLDFISWHSYSTDPQAEKENTIYKKSAVNLIRDWLTYFNFDRNTPLLVDEWNYDRNANILPERKEKSYIAASFIPSRLKNMFEADINYQIYFCLEDFQNNKEGVVRNVGAFYFDSEHSGYKGGSKAIYNIFRMLNSLGNSRLETKLDDEFVGCIATKSEDGLVLLLYNYIDPDIGSNYLSKNIASLSGGERKALLNLIKANKIDAVIHKKTEISSLHVTARVKNLLSKARELNERAEKLISTPRKIKINIKNLKDCDLFLRYVIDPKCSLDCGFKPAEEKEIDPLSLSELELNLDPYSVQMIMLKKKPKEVEKVENNTEKKE